MRTEIDFQKALAALSQEVHRAFCFLVYLCFSGVQSFCDFLQF